MNDPDFSQRTAPELRPHAVPAGDVLGALAVTTDGLADDEAARRLARFGPNTLPEPRAKTLAEIYLAQFLSPFIFLLLSAALISSLLREWADAGFILAVLVFNAAIGAFQEWRAETRARALKHLIASTVLVRRAGRVQGLDARALVPGDIVLVESGLRVPADLRLLRAQGLEADESLLTGESLSVEKDAAAAIVPAAPLGDRTTMLHAGTAIASGRGEAVVVTTGARTELGRIAASLAEKGGAPPPLIARMQRFTLRLAAAIIGVIALVAVLELMRGAGPGEVFVIAVALAVAAIPEGLPVAMTIALSVSVKRMGERNVLVRRLAAVEGLGSCTLIASDKTGTLTLNELTVRRLWLPGLGVCDEGHEEGKALANAAAATGEAHMGPQGTRDRATGDTVDIAVLDWALASGALDGEPDSGVKARIPYEPALRFAAAFRERDGATYAAVKGAPETIFAMCEGDCERANEAARELAAAGYRIIAVAAGPVASCGAESLERLTLLGLIGLIDPVRPGAAASVRAAHRAGIDVRMITGDHPLTARAIGRELGLVGDEAEGGIVTGAELARAAPDAVRTLIARARIFARIEPMQKLAIVRALTEAGHIVAVTGDGVNDAPALKEAAIGVAMGKGGTDVAREAADLILTDDRFSSVVAAVEEGRIAYANLRKVVLLLISTGAAEVMLFALSALAGLPPPLTAVQLLWLNLVTNGIQDVALAFEGGEPGLLDRKPRSPAESIIERRMIEQTLLSGGAMGLLAFGYYFWGHGAGLGADELAAQLLWLVVCLENVQVLNCRSETRSVFAVPVAANPFVIASVAVTQILQTVVAYVPGLGPLLGVTPLSPESWLAIVALALPLLAVMEIYKRLRR